MTCENCWKSKDLEIEMTDVGKMSKPIYDVVREENMLVTLYQCPNCKIIKMK